VNRFRQHASVCHLQHVQHAAFRTTEGDAECDVAAVPGWHIEIERRMMTRLSLRSRIKQHMRCSGEPVAVIKLRQQRTGVGLLVEVALTPSRDIAEMRVRAVERMDAIEQRYASWN